MPSDNRVLLKSPSGPANFVFAVCGILGFFAAFVAKNNSLNPNSPSALYLGMGLMAIGVIGFFFNRHTEITLEGNQLHLQRRSFFHNTTEVIPLQSVEHVKILRRQRSNGPAFYSIYLQCNDRPLVPTDYWGLQRDKIESAAESFARQISREFLSVERSANWDKPIVILGVTSRPYIVAALIAVAGYAVYYRLTVGPWCTAMWFGTAPVLIMAVLFFTSLQVIRRLFSS